MGCPQGDMSAADRSLQKITPDRTEQRHLFAEEEIPFLTDYVHRHLCAEIEALVAAADKRIS